MERESEERDSTVDTVTSVASGGHTAENCESTAAEHCNCGQWRHMAKSCTEKGRGKKARKKHRENTRRKEKAKTGKSCWRSPRVEGIGKGFQSVNEWDE